MKMTKKILTFTTLALIFINSHSFASFKQKITMCIDASADKDFIFSGHFGSTDRFDKGHDAKALPYGRNCTSHTYSAGPKNIAFKLKVDDKTTLLTPSATCGFLYNPSVDFAALLKSDPIRLTGKEENWVFTLIPNPPIGSFKHVYLLDCLHSAL